MGVFFLSTIDVLNIYTSHGNLAEICVKQTAAFFDKPSISILFKPNLSPLNFQTTTPTSIIENIHTKSRRNPLLDFYIMSSYFFFFDTPNREIHPPSGPPKKNISFFRLAQLSSTRSMVARSPTPGNILSVCASVMFSLLPGSFSGPGGGEGKK